MKTLFPPQQESLEVLVAALEQHEAALDSSDTGTGKTLKSVEISRISQSPPLVVCPKSVIPAWKETFDEQGVPYLDVLNYEKLRTGRTPWGDWEKERGVKKFQFADEVQFIIWDEVHKCKGRTTQNGKMLVGGKGRFNLMLSATAAEDPTELKNIGYLIGLFPSLHHYVPWAKKHGCYMDPWRNLKFATSKRDEVLGQLNAEIYPDRGHKVTRAEMGEFFQETHIVTEPLDFGDEGKIAEIYDLMDQELLDLEEAKAHDNPAGAALTAQLRARQEVELLKVPVLIEMANDYIEQGMSVAIFLNFDASITAVFEKLDVRAGLIWGKQSDTERQEVIRDFKDDEIRAVICNVAAGGVGVNLHDQNGTYPRVALISPSWNAKDIVQVTGRVDRAGGKTPTLQRILFGAGTVEDDVRKSVNKKLANLNTLHNKSV